MGIQIRKLNDQEIRELNNKRFRDFTKLLNVRDRMRFYNIVIINDEVLEGLKKQREELDKKIQDLEKEQAEKIKVKILERDYVKVVCVNCRGTGLTYSELNCHDCEGEGYLYAREWSNKRLHDEDDMKYNEVCAP